MFVEANEATSTLDARFPFLGNIRNEKYTPVLFRLMHPDNFGYLPHCHQNQSKAD
jgi:hypothetical protein